MSTTITIPPELEEQIAARASAEGKDIEEFVGGFIEEFRHDVKARLGKRLGNS